MLLLHIWHLYRYTYGMTVTLHLKSRYVKKKKLCAGFRKFRGVGDEEI